MSSSRASSSSPEPEVVSKKTKKGKGKQKKVRLADPAAQVDEDARIEGDDPNWDYQPPPGYTLMKHKVEQSEFDWDTINNDDNLELWVVRVPDGLKPKHLEGLKLELPSASKTSRIGSVERKNADYDVWQLGDDDADAVGGDELRAISCLLPRHKNDGKLYQAPHPVARRLVISARPSLPTPPASSPESSPVVHQNPPHPRHPAELLTHRFVPIGSLADENKDVDMDASPADPKPAPHESRKEAEQGEKSKKKRKVEVESPKKKTKKAKTTS